VTRLLPSDLVDLEECLARLRPAHREVLLRMLKGKTKSGTVRRQIRSAQAACKARWIAVTYYMLEAENPDKQQKWIIDEVLKANRLSFKSRSYVYEVVKELEETDPETARSLKADAAVSALIWGPHRPPK
jgi:hypothetical protein